MVAKLREITQSDPSALRVVVQADDGTDGIECTLAVAAAWLTGDQRIAVVNGTGRDLVAYGARYPLSELVDERGRPSRSLTEIVEALEAGLGDTIGAFVVLDTNSVYRATRCAVRVGEDIRQLGPGQWDDTNEALGLLGLLLYRAALPSVFLAPSTDVQGVNADGESVVVATKPQAWKDLARGAHCCLHLRRSAMGGVEAVVAGDDRRCVGQPGDVVAPDQLPRDLQLAGRGVRPTAGATTMGEATTAELGARDRRAAARRRLSAAWRDRFLEGEALLMAHHGAEAWGEFASALEADRSCLTDDDAKIIDQLLAATVFPGSALQVCLRVEQLADQTSGPAHDGWAELPGPSVLHAQPIHDDDRRVDWLIDCPVREAAVADVSDDDLAALCRALAEAAGVWTEHGLAAASAVSGLPALGPSWEPYGPRMQRQLALHLASLAAVRRRARVEAPATCTDEVLDSIDAELAREPEADPEPTLPIPESFAGMGRHVEIGWIDVLTDAHGWRGQFRQLCERAGIEPEGLSPARWGPADRAAVLDFLRTGPRPDAQPKRANQ